MKRRWFMRFTALIVVVLLFLNLHLFFTREWESSFSPTSYATLYYPLDVPTIREWKVVERNRLQIHLACTKQIAEWRILTAVAQDTFRTDGPDSINGAQFNLVQRARITGTQSDYYGFNCCEFFFEGRGARIVSPKTAAKGLPWLWRARFWGHFPQAEIALLERGFFLVYCDVAELYGNAEAIGIWDRFYLLLTGAGLSPRAAFIGYSRGGFYAYRWAAAYPDRIACVYADAPVLDMKSWAGGKGKSPGAPEEWARFKADFGLTSEEEAVAFKGNPLDMAEEIAAAGFPMLHICGDADISVPIEENTDPFEKRILAAGGRITVIRKPGAGHRPHGLPDPQPIVDFILEATATR